MDPATGHDEPGNDCEVCGVPVDSRSADAGWQRELVERHGDFLRDRLHRTLSEGREPRTKCEHTPHVSGCCRRRPKCLRRSSHKYRTWACSRAASRAVRERARGAFLQHQVPRQQAVDVGDWVFYWRKGKGVPLQLVRGMVLDNCWDNTLETGGCCALDACFEWQIVSSAPSVGWKKSSLCIEAARSWQSRHVVEDELKQKTWLVMASLQKGGSLRKWKMTSQRLPPQQKRPHHDLQCRHKPQETTCQPWSRDLAIRED